MVRFLSSPIAVGLWCVSSPRLSLLGGAGDDDAERHCRQPADGDQVGGGSGETAARDRSPVWPIAPTWKLDWLSGVASLLVLVSLHFAQAKHPCPQGQQTDYSTWLWDILRG